MLDLGPFSPAVAPSSGPPGARATPAATTADEPDPQDAATALASGLTAKDLSKVALTSDTATTAQASYDRITQEMDAAKLQVDTAGVEQTGSTAVATLHWTWDLTSATWEYDAEAELKLAEDGWQVAWAPSVVEPSLVEGEDLDVSAVAGRPRRHPRCRRRSRSSPSARCRGSASTRPSSARPTRPRPRASARPAGRGRRRAVREGGQGGRRAGVRRGDRLPRRRSCPAAVSSGIDRPSRAAGSSRPTCRSAPTRGLRRAAARQGRRGDRRDHRGAPGVPPR